MADDLDMDKLTLADDVSVRAATQDKMEQLRHEAEKNIKAGKLGSRSGPLAVPGRFFGWSEFTAVLDGQFLKYFARPEDIVLGNAYQELNVAGCQASLVAAAKHGRDFAFEVIIANPRSVHVAAATSVADAEAWVKALNEVKAVDTSKSGHVGNLSTDQQKALDDLKSKVGAGASDSDLLRFLRGTEWNVDKAKTYWDENKLWRTQFNVDKLTVNYVAREVRSGKMRLLNQTDKKGRPIVVLQPSKHSPKESSPLEVSKLLTYNLEQAVKMMKGDVESVVIIVDFKGMSPRAADLRVPKIVLETLQQRYPERVDLVLVVNAPWFFRFIWATIRTFFSADMLNKVHILGSDMTTLQAYVSPDALLREHGGTLDWDADEFLAARAKAEGVTVSSDSSAMAAMDGGIDQSLLASLRQLPANETAQGCVKKGYLTKLGAVVKNWKKRFFVLTEGGCLYYYKDDGSNPPQGVILLERSVVGDYPDKAHTFTVNTPLRSYIITCNNSEECDEWKKAITAVCASL
eukprot:m.68704 g.68704  ORF g.68704 m.68704 type:complete len:518 (+) comp14194_c0_seq1:74-1627(+)